MATKKKEKYVGRALHRKARIPVSARRSSADRIVNKEEMIQLEEDLTKTSEIMSTNDLVMDKILEDKTTRKKLDELMAIYC